MESEKILGVPFFNHAQTLDKFGILIDQDSLYTNLGLSQITITFAKENPLFICVIFIEGGYTLSEVGGSKEEALQKTLDKLRIEVTKISKIERALCECFSSFDVPTRKIRTSLLPQK